jgi:hypothetical protein
MKRITAIALVAFASLFTAGSALAQYSAVRSTVPFDFTVGNKLLPSGTYTITSESYGVILLRNSDRRISMFSITNSDRRELKGGGKLVFTKYGDQYFLSEVLCPDAAMNLSLPHSKLEKRIRLQEAMVHNDDQVLVAAK